ncbi:ABC transporter permease [Zhouia sp. PK063]|uniref:ABC transporter permease n=1 Tax=Zhouia sp. PK063 TaxID=3373602 RepID=UPI0037B76ED6
MGIFDRDLWSEVFATLGKNILRTILTTLGVIFAMIILILLLGSVQGMVNGFNKIFEGTATNSMFLWSQSTSKPYKGFERGRRINFDLDDVALIKRKVPEVETIAPRIQLGNFGGESTVIREGKKSGSSVYGDYPEMDDISKRKMVEGRFIDQNDIKEGKKVCVIGEDTYKLLFEKEEEAIGKYIQINGVYFAVVGIYKKNDKVDFDGSNAVFVPFTTYQRAFNSGNKIGWMAIAVKPNYKVAVAEKKIKDLLKEKYKVAPDDNRAIGSFNFAEIFEGISSFTLVLRIFSFFVGGMTLLAGVIAVSNILLITVKERTKEIGVRRALGATPFVIKRQIILESIVLTVFAGMIGFILGVGGLAVINKLFGSGEKFPFYNPTVGLFQLIGSFIIMISLSVLIGLIPAFRAIKIKPIEALREE